MWGQIVGHGWRSALQRPRRKVDADQGRMRLLLLYISFSRSLNNAETTQQAIAKDGAQFAIAIFDSWDALLCFLKKERIGTLSTSDAVLHARTDDPPSTLRSGLLKEMTQLRFTRARGQSPAPLTPSPTSRPQD
jgi:hypothetical protein